MVVLLSFIIIIKFITLSAPFKSGIKRRIFNFILALSMSTAIVVWVLPDALDMMSWLREIGTNINSPVPAAFDDFPLIWVIWQAIPVLVFSIWDYNPYTEWLGGRIAIIKDGSLGLANTIMVDRANSQTLLVDVDRAQMYENNLYVTGAGHYFLIDFKTMKILAYEKGKDIPPEYRNGFAKIVWPLL